METRCLHSAIGAECPLNLPLSERATVITFKGEARVSGRHRQISLWAGSRVIDVPGSPVHQAGLEFGPVMTDGFPVGILPFVSH